MDDLPARESNLALSKIQYEGVAVHKRRADYPVVSVEIDLIEIKVSLYSTKVDRCMRTKANFGAATYAAELQRDLFLEPNARGTRGMCVFRCD